MSGSIYKAGAAYEAVLVDRVTQHVNKIIASLDRLKQAFEGVDPAAGSFNQNMTEIAGAMKTVDQVTNQTARRMETIGSKLKGWGAQISATGQAIGQAFIHIGNQLRNIGAVSTAAAGGIAAMFLSASKSAADAEEANSAFAATFGRSTQEIEAWAEQQADAINRSGIEMKKTLTTFRALAGDMNMSEKEANDFAKTFTALSRDLASFRDLADEEADRRMLGALVGQPENLIRFGINVSAAELAVSEFGKSIGKTAGEMTKMEKMQARIGLIINAMDKLNMTGDAFRTRFSLTNQTKGMTAAFGALNRTIGELVRGPATQIVGILTRLAEKMQELSSENVRSVIGIMVGLGTVGVGLMTAGTALAMMGPPILAIASVASSLLTAVGALIAMGPVGAIIAAAGLAIATVAGSFGFFIGKALLVRDTLTRLRYGFEQLGETATSALTGVSAALELGEWEAALEVIKVSTEIAFREIGAMIIDVLSEALKTGTLEWLKWLGTDLVAGAISRSISGGLVPKSVIKDIGASITEKVAGPEVEAASNRLEMLKDRLVGLVDDLEARQMNTRAAARDMDREIDARWDAIIARMSGDAGGAAAEPAKEVFEAFRAASVGGFGGGFGAIAGAVAPVMSPIEKNQEKMIQNQQEQIGLSKETKELLDRINQKEAEFF